MDTFIKMKINRKKIEREVEYTLTAEPEEIVIRGNCSASGDDDEDEKCARWIEEELEAGNVWAWAAVKVEARWRSFVGVDYLGGCSYMSEEDFKQPGGYYDDMKAAALDDLIRNIESAAQEVLEAV